MCILTFYLCRYFLASFYTKYDPTHFILNTASLLSVLIPKMPQLHGVRIFGINKYWNVSATEQNSYSYCVPSKERVVNCTVSVIMWNKRYLHWRAKYWSFIACLEEQNSTKGCLCLMCLVYFRERLCRQAGQAQLRSWWQYNEGTVTKSKETRGL